jgi:hypothetical protein
VKDNEKPADPQRHDNTHHGDHTAPQTASGYYCRPCHLGRLSKRLLDEGRCAYLRDHGWESVRLVRYVDWATSPENSLIIGLAP